TCDQALAAVERGLDGALSAREHRALRAHLRACESCAGVARRRRGRRRRVGGLALLPFPLPLKSLFGGGSASAGAGSAGGGGGGEGGRGGRGGRRRAGLGQGARGPPPREAARPAASAGRGAPARGSGRAPRNAYAPASAGQKTADRDRPSRDAQAEAGGGSPA